MKTLKGKTRYQLISFLCELLLFFISSFMYFPLHIKRIILFISYHLLPSQWIFVISLVSLSFCPHIFSLESNGTCLNLSYLHLTSILTHPTLLSIFPGLLHMITLQLRSIWEPLKTLLIIAHEDVVMILFSIYLVWDASFWLRGLEAGSISSWTDFYCAFSKYLGENKSLGQYLDDFHALRRGEEEAFTAFNMRFYCVYYSMPLEIHPIETAAIVYYIPSQYLDLVLFLRESKYSSLQQLFEDAKELEENIRASKRIKYRDF